MYVKVDVKEEVEEGGVLVWYVKEGRRVDVKVEESICG